MIGINGLSAMHNYRIQGGGNGMPIFRLASGVNYAIDSRYIQSFDLIVQNLGEHDFEILVQAYNEAGNIHTSLHQVSNRSFPGSTLIVRDIFVHYSPLSFQLATTTLDDDTTSITLIAKNNGNEIAVFRTMDFMKIE
jgi:hypothetical protein